jgi:hypothetical protein
MVFKAFGANRFRSVQHSFLGLTSTMSDQTVLLAAKFWKKWGDTLGMGESL